MGILNTLAAQADSNNAVMTAVRTKASGHTSLCTAAQQLSQLNFRYLSLSATCSEFSRAIAIHLIETCPEQRRRMADCRFSLFSLGLNDSGRWLPLLHRGFIDAPLPAADSLDRAARKELSTSVVFLAWHFAQSQPLAAKVLLCMNDDIAAALRDVPVAHLPSIADTAGEWLSPRWPRHPIFWSALLRHSRDHSGSRLAAIKALGRQLLAAESLELPNLSKTTGKRPLRSNIVGISAASTSAQGRPRSAKWSESGCLAD